MGKAKFKGTVKEFIKEGEIAIKLEKCLYSEIKKLPKSKRVTKKDTSEIIKKCLRKIK